MKPWMQAVLCVACAAAPIEQDLEPPPTPPARPEVAVSVPPELDLPTLDECEATLASYLDADDMPDPQQVAILVDAATCYEAVGYIGHAIRVHKIVAQNHPTSEPARRSRDEVARLLPLLAAPEGDAGVGYARCTEQLDLEEESAGAHVDAADCLYRKALIGAALAHRQRAAALGGEDDPENRAAIEHLRDRLARVEAMIAGAQAP